MHITDPNLVCNSILEICYNGPDALVPRLNTNPGSRPSSNHKHLSCNVVHLSVRDLHGKLSGSLACACATSS